MQKITPFLWFNGNAEEAMNFYISIFKDAKIVNTRRQEEHGPLITGTLRIGEQEFFMLNGGPQHTSTDAISFFVHCETQAEVDHLWIKLSAGGRQQRCGWLKDKFGISWQIIPSILGTMLSDKDPMKSQRVMDAMLQMNKIDIAVLKKAYDQ